MTAASEAPIHFGLWVEVTVVLPHLELAERQALFDALDITEREFRASSSSYMAAILANTVVSQVDAYIAASVDAHAAGREGALRRLAGLLERHAPAQASPSDLDVDATRLPFPGPARSALPFGSVPNPEFMASLHAAPPSREASADDTAALPLTADGSVDDTLPFAKTNPQPPRGPSNQGK